MLTVATEDGHTSDPHENTLTALPDTAAFVTFTTQILYAGKYLFWLWFNVLVKYDITVYLFYKFCIYFSVIICVYIYINFNLWHIPCLFLPLQKVMDEHHNIPNTGYLIPAEWVQGLPEFEFRFTLKFCRKNQDTPNYYQDTREVSRPD